MKVFIIIPAAGSSTRMGRDKLFIEVNGKSVIHRTLEAFEEFSKQLKESDIELSAIVVTSTRNIEPICELVNNNNFAFVKNVIEGGASRTESVWKGINSLSELDNSPEDKDIVFIHDGARCLVSQEVLTNCISGMNANDICVAAVPAKNTIKKIVTVPKVDGVSDIFQRSKLSDTNIIVDYTPSRDELMEIQTPQCFRYDKLFKSYSYAIANNIGGTDDTELAERLGFQVAIVQGSYSNIKITTPEDVAMAESMCN